MIQYINFSLYFLSYFAAISPQRVIYNCRSDEWQCANGQCIDTNKWCDGSDDCRDRSDESQATCAWSVCPQNQFNCGTICIDEHFVCNGVRDCPDGSDESAQDCPPAYNQGPTASSCKPPNVANGVTNYKLLTKYVGNKKSESVDIQVTCNKGYLLSSGNLTCDNGFWSGVPSQCVKCGKPVINQNQHGISPWHAGIYTKVKRPYDQICVGSLISANHVLSAAQCFWDDAVGLLPAPIYLVAVGKAYQPWDHFRDNYSSQKNEADEIIIPPKFNGQKNNWDDNLAVITLASPFVFTNFVIPICVDLSNQAVNYLEGYRMISGWGFTADSELLQVLNVPLISRQRCNSKSPSSFTKFIIEDKLCVEYDGEATIEGLSGSGLVFTVPTNGINYYYLQGVASVGTPEANVPLLYTNVFVYKSLVGQFI